MNEYVVSLITAFVGTIGFSIFFNIKKERLLYVAVSGTQEMFRIVGMQTVQSALGIAVGILVATSFFYQVTKLARFIMMKLEMQYEKNLK